MNDEYKAALLTVYREQMADAANDVLARVNALALAATISGLIADHEPLLAAAQDGALVIVRERGGPAVMLVTVETMPEERQ